MTPVLSRAQAASADVSARETRVKAAEEQLGTLRTQVGQQKAAADSRQASWEAQAVELQARSASSLAHPGAAHSQHLQYQLTLLVQVHDATLPRVMLTCRCRAAARQTFGSVPLVPRGAVKRLH